MAESETHVAVSHEAEPEPEHTETEEAAAAAVATAGAAVALAHETAAHAELQAAEEVAEVAEEIDEWRSNLSANLLRMNERLEELGALEAARHSNDELLHARLEALETHPSLRSIPLASEAEEAEEASETETSEEANPLVGGEVAANVGPVEAASSASLQNPLSPSEEPARPKRKRHWI